MKLQHTPGPWRSSFPPHSNGFYHIDSGHNDHGDVATCFSVHHHEATEANARLIAAAPEMLEFILDMIKSQYELTSPRERQAIEIIERATGKKIEEVLE